MFPHNWMIFAFILRAEGREAQQWRYMRHYTEAKLEACRRRLQTQMERMPPHTHTHTLRVEKMSFSLSKTFAISHSG